MKKLLFIVCLCTQNIYAMSCPSTGKILDTGVSLEQTIQLCGQPVSVKMTLSFNGGKLANINILDTRNTANQTCQATNHFGQTINTPCAHQEQNLSISGVCGPLIQAGNKIDYVRYACGNPASQNISFPAKRLKS